MLAWHALHVKHQCEAIVADALEGLTTFWPHRTAHDNCGRSVRRPWFPGYLFVQCDWTDPVQRLRILRTNHLIAMLAVDSKPCEIPASEIESLRILAATKAPVSQHPYMQLGEFVRVVRGPLAGVEGKVMRFKGASLLIVQVEILQRSVSVELEPDVIEAVARRSLQPSVAA